jgi:hypothetical protein
VANNIVVHDKYTPLFTHDGIKTRYVLVTGGRGSGKSFGVTLATAMKLYDKGHKVLFTRYTLDSAEDSVIPEFEEKLDLMEVRYDFIIRKKQISNKDSGSTILFRGIKTSSGRQTAKLKSIQGITIFVVDEGEEMPEADFDTIDRGIRSQNNQNIVVIIMNPSDTEHWVYKRFIKDTHRFEVVDGYPVPISTHTDVTHIHTTYLDNLDNLDTDYIKAVILPLKEKDPEQYAAKIVGTWQDIRTGLEAYNHFNFGRHVRDFPFNLNLPVNASFDQNVVPYAYTSLWQFIFKQDHIILYCYDEIVGRPPFHHTGETCKEIKRRHNRMAGFNYYGDASGNKRDTRTANTDYRIVEGHMRDFVNERSNRTWRMNPNVKKRLEFINLILAGLMPKVKVYINPKCTVMISDLAKVKVDANGDKAKEMDTVDGIRFQKYGHCFVAGTKVTTIAGEKNIEDIRQGDMVLTRFGYRKVLGAGMTGENMEVRTYQIAGKEITCTPNHKIWTTYGFIEVKDIVNKLIEVYVSTDTGLVLQTCRPREVKSVQTNFKDVFDITVDEHHEFFANGLLVMNSSDTFDYIIIKALEREFQNFIKSKHKYVKIYN